MGQKQYLKKYTLDFFKIDGRYLSIQESRSSVKLKQNN